MPPLLSPLLQQRTLEERERAVIIYVKFEGELILLPMSHKKTANKKYYIYHYVIILLECRIENKGWQFS
jgi:hypothetical protein